MRSRFLLASFGAAALSLAGVGGLVGTASTSAAQTMGCQAGGAGGNAGNGGTSDGGTGGTATNTPTPGTDGGGGAQAGGGNAGNASGGDGGRGGMGALPICNQNTNGVVSDGGDGSGPPAVNCRAGGPGGAGGNAGTTTGGTGPTAIGPNSSAEGGNGRSAAGGTGGRGGQGGPVVCNQNTNGSVIRAPHHRAPAPAPAAAPAKTTKVTAPPPPAPAQPQAQSAMSDYGDGTVNGRPVGFSMPGGHSSTGTPLSILVTAAALVALALRSRRPSLRLLATRIGRPASPRVPAGTPASSDEGWEVLGWSAPFSATR